MSRNLMAILRGVQPQEVLALGTTLVSAGITQIEVPLNSPDAITSIQRLVEGVGDKADIGAGTVLSVDAVKQVAAVGGRFIVSPNGNLAVIQATKALGLVSYPGVMTPSECFAALDAGADKLKLFPASLLGVAGFKAIKAVLPIDTQCYAVGGIDAHDFATWRQAGISGFGLGSNLYQPGDSPEQLALKANQLVTVWDAANASL